MGQVPGRRRRQRAGAIALAVAVSGYLGGCADEQHDVRASHGPDVASRHPVRPVQPAQPARPYGPAIPADAAVRRLVLPFDAYTLNDADIAMMMRAQDLATARCMREQSLRWPVRPAVPRDSWPNRRRYGVVEMRVARTYGYHPPPGPAEQRPADVGRDEPPALTAQQRAAAFGTDGHSGCVGQAGAELLRSVPRAELSLLERLDGRIWNDVQREHRVVAAFGRWGACMRRHGYAVTDPIAVNSDKRWRSEQPSATERATATADVSCKQQTGLVATWFGAESRAQRQAIAEHAHEFAVLKAVKHQMIDNAQVIIDAADS